jgi:hypothetical protein
VLFVGYVVSAQDTVTSTLDRFTYSFEVHLATPEAMIPTNPTTESHSISQHSGQLQLESDALLAGVKKSGTVELLAYMRPVVVELEGSNAVNIAKVVATAIDKNTTNQASDTDLPSSISDVVNVGGAPLISVPGTQATEVVAPVVERVVNLQNSGYSDWVTFVSVMNEFYLNPVPEPSTGKLILRKAFPWSPDVAATIEPSAFVGFQNTHITALNGVFRAVAVCYPWRSDQSVSTVTDLASYYLAAAGYTAEGQPKWVSEKIGAASGSGNYSIGGVRLTNIRKMPMPSWMFRALLSAEKDGQGTWIEMADKRAKAIATASVLHNIGAQGSLQLRMRLLPAIQLYDYIGRVICVQLPTSPPEESEEQETRALYGMLRDVSIDIILQNKGISVSGNATIVATRAQAEQDEFCVTSGIFTDEQSEQ